LSSFSFFESLVVLLLRSVDMLSLKITNLNIGSSSVPENNTQTTTKLPLFEMFHTIGFFNSSKNNSIDLHADYRCFYRNIIRKKSRMLIKVLIFFSKKEGMSLILDIIILSFGMLPVSPRINEFPNELLQWSISLQIFLYKMS